MADYLIACNNTTPYFIINIETGVNMPTPYEHAPMNLNINIQIWGEVYWQLRRQYEQIANVSQLQSVSFSGVYHL